MTLKRKPLFLFVIKSQKSHLHRIKFYWKLLPSWILPLSPSLSHFSGWYVVKQINQIQSFIRFVVLRWGFCEYSRKNDTRTKWNVSLIYLISYVRDDDEWATVCAMIRLPFYHSVIFVQCVMSNLLNPRVITP